jgi:PilZ domain
MNDADPAGDKRHTSRHRTLKGAKIVFKDGAFTYDCTVKNLSAVGALLLVSSTGGIPNQFQLVLDDHSPPHKCEVAWRSANRLGVTFQITNQN